MKRFSLILSLVFVLSVAVGLSIARADYTGCGYDSSVNANISVQYDNETALDSDIWTVLKKTIPLAGTAWAMTDYTFPGINHPEDFDFGVGFTLTNLPSDPENSTVGLRCMTIGGVGTYNAAKITTEKADLVLMCDMWAPHNGDVNDIRHLCNLDNWWLDPTKHCGSGELKYNLIEKTNKATATFTFIGSGHGKLFTSKGSFQFVDTPCP